MPAPSLVCFDDLTNQIDLSCARVYFQTTYAAFALYYRHMTWGAAVRFAALSRA